MQKLFWQNANGETIDLTSTPYGITNWEGFSNTPLNIQSQQVPFQDGGVFLDALIEQRELSITLAIYDGNNLEKRYQYRRELIHILNPKLGEGYLIYTNDFISKRIKCVPQIPLFETHNSNNSGTPKASLSWTACSPYWEDVEKKSVALTSRVIKPVFNDGEVPTEMEIDLFISNAKNPKIENLTTGKAIELNGTFDDNINININMGKKTVTSNKMAFTYTNISNAMNIFYSERFGLYIMLTGDENNMGTVYSSKDFKKWDFLATYGSNVIINDEMIYIIGYDSDLKTTDGKTWITVTHININKVCYSETLNKYFGISSGKIYSSTDLVTWTEVCDTTYSLVDICCSDNLICAICEYDYIYTSSDGENWTSIENEARYKAIIYAKELNLFCVVGYNGFVSTSSDGATWNNITIESDTNDYTSVGYLSGVRTIFIVNEVNVYKTVNGINWELVNLEGYKGIVSIADYSAYIPCGDFIMRCIDGINWEEALSQQIMPAVAYSEKLGIYCAIRTGGSYINIYYSYDCINWIKTDIEREIWTGGNEIICYSEKLGIFEASDAGCLFYSKDGIHWTEGESFQYNLDCFCVAEKLGMIIAVGSGFMIRTTDGINWDFTLLEDFSLYDVCYSEKLGLFCGNANIYGSSYYGTATSTDGINWTSHAISQDFRGRMCKSENLGLFVNISDEVNISTDGINWTFVTNLKNQFFPQSSFFPASVIYSEELGLFCVVSTEAVLISPDCINWENKIVSSWAYGNYYGFEYVTYLKKLDALYMSGDYASVITSTETVTNIISSLEKNSDMSLSLILGNNDLILTQESGGLSGRVSFRQKYIGV